MSQHLQHTPTVSNSMRQVESLRLQGLLEGSLPSTSQGRGSYVPETQFQNTPDVHLSSRKATQHHGTPSSVVPETPAGPTQLSMTPTRGSVPERPKKPLTYKELKASPGLGANVEARWSNGRWFAATVVEVGDGYADIQFQGKSSPKTLTLVDIRPMPEADAPSVVATPDRHAASPSPRVSKNNNNNESSMLTPRAPRSSRTSESPYSPTNPPGAGLKVDVRAPNGRWYPATVVYCDEGGVVHATYDATDCACQAPIHDVRPRLSMDNLHDHDQRTIAKPSQQASKQSSTTTGDVPAPRTPPGQRTRPNQSAERFEDDAASSRRSGKNKTIMYLPMVDDPVSVKWRNCKWYPAVVVEVHEVWAKVKYLEGWELEVVSLANVRPRKESSAERRERIEEFERDKAREVRDQKERERLQHEKEKQHAKREEARERQKEKREMSKRLRQDTDDDDEDDDRSSVRSKKSTASSRVSTSSKRSSRQSSPIDCNGNMVEATPVPPASPTRMRGRPKKPSSQPTLESPEARSEAAETSPPPMHHTDTTVTPANALTTKSAKAKESVAPSCSPVEVGGSYYCTVDSSECRLGRVVSVDVKARTAKMQWQDVSFVMHGSLRLPLARPNTTADESVVPFSKIETSVRPIVVERSKLPYLFLFEETKA
eukprot:PhM_4_TR10505/c0_g1_i1/m.101330